MHQKCSFTSPRMQNRMATPLQQELEKFEQVKPELLKDEGKFAVIHKDWLIGVFESYEDALKVGYSKCGVNPFLVKKIMAVEPINFFSRDLAIV